MEWLEQTKRISKSHDYITLEVIDSILDYLWIIDKKVIQKHKELLNDICGTYHKPNPVDLVKKREKIDELFKERHGMGIQDWCQKAIKDPSCKSFKLWNDCVMSKYCIKWLSSFVDGSLNRCEKANKDMLWQWFEVIDFMYERPELINPALIDEYIETVINKVCEKHRKNNPLSNGYRERFGKFWKDKDGKWQKEKRARF
jgi:hypothetical protein